MTSMAAQGIHDDPEFKTGKKKVEINKKTVMMADMLDRAIQIAVSYDFDKGRAAFKPHLWGNDEYGDCVLACRANGLVRLERVETRSTPGITDQHVVDKYKVMTGCQSPGDQNDVGLNMNSSNNDWRNGWSIKFGTTTKTFKIAAYGYIRPNDHWLMRASIYLFTGVQLGFNLPASAQQDTRNGVWQTTTGPGSEPGSWGGHAVYAKRYDADNISVITWGREVRVTNAFMDKYCDEGWAVIDDLDPWRQTHGVLDVNKLLDYFKQVGIRTS